MEAFDNELFGPAASVMRAKDDAHAVELANNSQFGLGSGVFTGNIQRKISFTTQQEVAL
jgi:succinate-semialdehyde dehydrogenase/glutarate-semialdehyde dehydrogenase